MSSIRHRQDKPFASLSQNEQRNILLDALERIVQPILTAGAAGELRVRMPVEAAPGMETDRARFSHLEAVGRLLCGMTPWLELRGLEGPEESLRIEFAQLAHATIAHSVNPASAGFLNFEEGRQPIVDAAFLSQALLRAPHTLWMELDSAVQRNLCNALAATRVQKPHFNNWLLFTAIIEAFLARAGFFGSDACQLCAPPAYAVVPRRRGLWRWT